MIDILYLAKGRPEFTDASSEALTANTSRALVESVQIYTDGMPRKVFQFGAWEGLPAEVNHDCFGGPVAIMNHFIGRGGADIFAKIDNDVIVPPGWLDAAFQVMEEHPMLDFLGLEPPASRTANPSNRRRESTTPENGHAMCSTHLAHYSLFPQHGPACFARADAIGGVGLFRRSAFAGRPRMKPHGFNGVGGWTGWQLENPDPVKGWIMPPLKLFLLDRLPFEPWLSLSRKYIAAGEQRPWTNYDANLGGELWDWWGK